MDPLGLIIVIGLLLLPLYVAERLVPGPYRLVRRLMRRVGDFAMFRQAQRRGFLFAICVHFFLFIGLMLIALGLLTGTLGAVPPGLFFVAIAIVAYRLFGALRRLRGRHRSLPTRRK